MHAEIHVRFPNCIAVLTQACKCHKHNWMLRMLSTSTSSQGVFPAWHGTKAWDTRMVADIVDNAKVLQTRVVKAVLHSRAASFDRGSSHDA